MKLSYSKLAYPLFITTGLVAAYYTKDADIGKYAIGVLAGAMGGFATDTFCDTINMVFAPGEFTKFMSGEDFHFKCES